MHSVSLPGSREQVGNLSSDSSREEPSTVIAEGHLQCCALWRIILNGSTEAEPLLMSMHKTRLPTSEVQYIQCCICFMHTT